MDFRAIVDEVLAGYFRQYPVQATEIGHHAYDGDGRTGPMPAGRLAWHGSPTHRLRWRWWRPIAEPR